MPAAGRLQTARVGGLVHRRDDCLNLDRQPAVFGVGAVDWPFRSSGNGGYSVEAGWTVGVIDDGVTRLQVFPRAARERSDLWIEEVVIADCIFFQIHRISVDA